MSDALIFFYKGKTNSLKILAYFSTTTFFLLVFSAYSRSLHSLQNCRFSGEGSISTEFSFESLVSANFLGRVDLVCPSKSQPYRELLGICLQQLLHACEGQELGTVHATFAVKGAV